MKWIWNSKNRIDVEQLKYLQPTSKTSLKNQCMMLSGGDIEKAERIYDFYMRDIDDLPTNDPVDPTWLDSTKNVVSGIMQWVSDNPNTASGIYQVLQSLSGGRLPAITLPQAGAAGAEAAAQTVLPPINE